MSQYARRVFLRQASVLGAAFSILPAGFLRAASKLRIGIIGSGEWGLRYLALASQHPDVEVRALCEPDAVRRSQALSLCPFMPDVHAHWQQLVASKTVDAVLIATPWQWHGKMALAALQAGKHVLCGPVAATTPQGHEALLRASLERGRQYITLNETDFDPDHLAVCAMVRQGLFGTIDRVHTGVHCARLPGDVYALQGAASVLPLLDISTANPFTSFSLHREKREYLEKIKGRNGHEIVVVRHGEIPVMDVRTAAGQSLVLQMPQRSGSAVAIGFSLQGSEGRWLEAQRMLQRRGMQPDHQWEPGRPHLEQYRNEEDAASATFRHAVSLLQRGRHAAPAVYEAIALSRLQALGRQARKQGQTAVALQGWYIA